MPSTRDIRRRIKSVKNTSQITKAMQMVAASKMRNAQVAALRGRPYADGMNRVLASLAYRAEDIQHPLWKDSAGANAKPCVLVLSTDKGLCGGLNTNLFREIHKMPSDTVFVSIGRRARQLLVKTGRDLLADFPLREKPTFIQSKSVSKFLIEQFTAGVIGTVSVLYSQFVNTLVQRPLEVPLLPIRELGFKAGMGADGAEEQASHQAKDLTAHLDYLYEPSARHVLDDLFPAFVHFQVYHLLLEAQASEHSARMVAMKNATENAKSLVSDLTLEYNKARQAAITNEILEISAAQLAMQ
ncbi:MAG: ATP synthase F1 subunit gamma [Candidatus Methylacidiphilales bacterium]